MAKHQDIKDDSDQFSLDKVPQESTQHVEELMRGGLNAEDAHFLHNVPEKEQRRIFHKVDVRLVPMLALLLVLSFPYSLRSCSGRSILSRPPQFLSVFPTDNGTMHSYLIAHLDRANIGNAKIEGLEASLNMTGTDYNVAREYKAIKSS